MFQLEHFVWSQSTPNHLEGSWQQAPSEQWHAGNFHNYQRQHQVLTLPSITTRMTLRSVLGIYL
jgi:hypothetical protein